MAESAVSRKQCANAIRALSMDAVQKANSGHPGAPMGMADIAEVLWKDHLSHSPSNPKWLNRDRFVLSNGHGSMLIYSLLHLTGYDVSIEDIKQFRQMDSKTPGHPEYGYTPGVETTTGPLGQGLANAVGMAIAEKTLGAQFNRPGFDVVDHHTYVFAGDGCRSHILGPRKYRLYPPNSSSPASPDKATVTCSRAARQTRCVGIWDESANGSS